MHIMLDLETWGKTPGCDIRSIGACVFDPIYGYVAEPCGDENNDSKSFYIATDNPLTCGDVGTHDKYCHKYPLARDPDTVKWWSEQSAEAQAAFNDPIDLHDALRRFSNWLATVTVDARIITNTIHVARYGDVIDQSTQPLNKWGGLRLYTHGPHFDVSILAACYDAVGLPVPWHYRSPRDTRTAFDWAGIDDDGDASYRTFMSQYNTGTMHHALDDAIAQAKAVGAAWQIVYASHDD